MRLRGTNGEAQGRGCCGTVEPSRALKQNFHSQSAAVDRWVTSVTPGGGQVKANLEAGKSALGWDVRGGVRMLSADLCYLSLPGSERKTDRKFKRLRGKGAGERGKRGQRSLRCCTSEGKETGRVSDGGAIPGKSQPDKEGL